jgi:YfiH family protein
MNPDLLTYEIAPQVTAFSTKRHGGYSQGNYAAFNVNLYCGDDTQSICRNRQMLCSFLGVDESCLVMPHQTHQTKVCTVDDSFFSLGKEERTAALEGVDAVTTSLKNVCIGVSTADCIPILLYDTEHHVAAAVHAGWRGTVARIVEKTVTHMQQRYGSLPQRMKAVIGPGISLECFEVGEELYTVFAEAGFPMDDLTKRFPAMRNDEVGEKWHIDLPRCNRLQLLTAGLPASQILSSGICTYQQSDDFFSARRLGIQSGRIFTGIVLR